MQPRVHVVSFLIMVAPGADGKRGPVVVTAYLPHNAERVLLEKEEEREGEGERRRKGRGEINRPKREDTLIYGICKKYDVLNPLSPLFFSLARSIKISPDRFSCLLIPQGLHRYPTANITISVY